VDADHRFVSFAARARVIVANTQLVAEAETPRSIWDLAKPRWKGKVGIAKPIFGTTLTHTASLFEALGEEKAKEWLRALKANEVRILPGNGAVRDQVAAGELEVGLTDTDDANGAVVDGKPVRVVYPDADGLGTLVMPNTIALVKGAPNAAEGRAFIDWVLRPEVEARLAASRSAQMPVRATMKVPEGFVGLPSIKAMPVDFDKAASRLPEVFRFLEDEFLR
jgi:iron(III) transport system substrate-binding protein